MVASKSGERTERSQSINGRIVPLEQSEERVIREDANGKVTEKIVRRFNQTGELTSTERVVTDEQKRPGGGTSSHRITYRSDVNGGMKEDERVAIETRSQGAVTYTDTIIQRPDINGSFATSEKRKVVSETSGSTTHTDDTFYRKSPNGDFSEAVRKVSDVQKTGDTVVSKTANYEPGDTGQLQLKSQSVSTSTTRPDGSETTEVSLYTNAAEGRTEESGGRQYIREQQVIERRPGPGGAVIETLSVRRPILSDPTRLGSLRQVSETVCKGKCTSDGKP